MGAISSVGFSVVAAPMTETVKTEVQTLEQPAVCPIGYIQDEIVSINKEAKTITFGDAKDVEGQKVAMTSNGIILNGQVNAIEITIL